MSPTRAEGHREGASRSRFENRGRGHLFLEQEGTMATLLWIIAVALVIWGIVTLVRGGVLMGILLIVVGLLVGPGGVSIFG